MNYFTDYLSYHITYHMVDQILDENLAEEYVTLLNVYLTYYKNLHNKDPDFHMFSDENAIAMFEQDMRKLAEASDDMKTIINTNTIDMNQYETMFMLNIDGQDVACQLVFPLIQYVAGYDDWCEHNWNILQIK